MPSKNRKAVIDQDRLKTLAFQEEMERQGKFREHDRTYILAALIWAFLAALPSLSIGRPIPYMVGTTAPYDIHSRVDFKWHDAIAEAQALRNLETAFARRYREEPLNLWANETHGPIDQFLIRAATADSFGEVEQAAKELNIPASREQLNTLWQGALVAKNDPHHYLVSPLREVLDNELFPQGILPPERFETERGRTIQIMRADSSYTAMVGGERGPVRMDQVGDFLSQRFKLKMSAWIPEDFKTALADIVVRRLRPNLVYDEAGSRAGLEEHREELLARVQSINANDTLLSRGSIIDFDKLAQLREEEYVYRQSQGWRLPITRFIGNFLLFAAISFALVIYFKTVNSNPRGTLRRFYATTSLCLLLVYAGYGLIYLGLPGTMLPIGIAVGIAVFGMGVWTAMVVGALTAMCGLILYEGRPDLMVGYLAGGLFFIQAAVRCRWRLTLLLVSCLSGLIGATAFIAWNFARGDLQNLYGVLTPWAEVLDDTRGPLLAALGLFLNWNVCGAIVLLLLPVIEWFFGTTTRIHLQDLSVEEHPLLRRLIIEAPGTYHHSTIVSTLAEAGSAAVGADTLTARIGGLYHDIGKLLKPEYFTENEFGVSRHKNMNPNMSALLIINHVRDGAEMARAFGLPNAVIDMILQHHGDSLMRFFYMKAIEQAPPGTVVAREPFVYPGPKPQTREAGILMIADSVEAAVRSLDTPSPKHLRDLLSRLIRERLVDGQFEESGLTMSELAAVEDVLFRMLVSMYHTRVKYPGQTVEAVGRRR